MNKIYWVSQIGQKVYTTEPRVPGYTKVIDYTKHQELQTRLEKILLGNAKKTRELQKQLNETEEELVKVLELVDNLNSKIIKQKRENKAQKISSGNDLLEQAKQLTETFKQKIDNEE